MRLRGPAAPSLRQFEHTDEIYKESLLPLDCPRNGDYAEITRAHCTAGETGMLVQVVDFPHWCKSSCADCHLHVFEWIVRVEPVKPIARWEQQAPGGPWFYPLRWLRRWEAHQVSFTDVEKAL